MPILGNYNVCVFSLLGMIGFLWYMHFEKLVVHLLDSLKRVCVFSVFKDIITYMVSLLGYIYIYTLCILGHSIKETGSS